MDSITVENVTKTKTLKKAIVVPSYKVSDSLPLLLEKIPSTSVDYIIVVDDKCPDGSGLGAEKLNKKNCVVIYHEQNQGVGGAVISGYLKALDLGCDIIV
ncbi:MAG: glycosyltransferase, partial [Candidatus Omnitrophica bacterium]|nr:glycosyltransferase [Candidatus Omnitrophota bacterium]